MLLDLSRGRGATASTRSGSATASSRSRATSRSRCSPRSRSGPRGSGSARPAWCRRLATRSTSRSSGRRSTRSRAAARSSAPAMGNPEEGVRREFEALGLDYAGAGRSSRRAWPSSASCGPTGTVDASTGVLRLRRRLRSTRARRWGRSMPVQKPPPIWVVSNPRLKGDAPADVMQRRLEAACRRIVCYGDGWMTCCRAQHPEELVEQLGWIRRGRGRRSEPTSTGSSSPTR